MLIVPVIVVICLCVGYVYKKFFPADNKFIPLILFILGSILGCIDDYVFLGGRTIWKTSEIGKLQFLLKHVLGIGDSEFVALIELGSPDEVRRVVRERTTELTDGSIEEICHVLTIVDGD